LSCESKKEVEARLEKNYPNWRESQKRQWEEFYSSYNIWWSWCITPLSHESMLWAVAYGEAEVKLIEDDKEWPGDVFFRWIKPVEERKYEYFEKKCYCESCYHEEECPKQKGVGGEEDYSDLKAMVEKSTQERQKSS